MSLTRTQRTVGWAAICVSCVAGFEGLRTSTYFDVGGVPTACFGETRNIKVGDKFTPEQCREMLADRIIQDFGPGVDRCIHHALPDKRKAAYTSFAYNVGVQAFCGSSAARLENVGKYAEACESMMKWNKIKVAGVLVYSPGLNNRRTQERDLCLEGVDGASN